ncbi:MAG: hypothetical protein AB1735_04115 [Pseudomonadota bacterium]
MSAGLLGAAGAANDALGLAAPAAALPDGGGGEPIPAGLPSPAAQLAAPAATGVGGFTGAAVALAHLPTAADWGADCVLVGQLVGARQPTQGDFERLQRARTLLLALRPLLDLPERHKGRRAMAEQIAAGLGLSWQSVYRLAALAAEGGVLALARLGQRADSGQARKVVSGPWQAWAQRAVAQFRGAQDVLTLAGLMLAAVRSAWVSGATSERQAWLKATASLGKEMSEAGAPQALVAALLQVPCPRSFVAAEGQLYRVAGRSLRDAKGCYDQHIAPVQRTAAQYQPGDLVCGDISPLDIPVARPDGSTAYARMIAWHDISTNWLWVDLFLCDKGQGVRREHVAASFARLCERAPFGAPRRLYLDNGSEYKWDDLLFAWAQLAQLTGNRFAVEEAALLPSSGKLVRSIPFHPRGKRIEGQFGNLRHYLGWWFGYVGGNRMAKRVANLGAAPVVSDFGAVRDWLDATLADYHVTPQPGAEHMQRLSPQQRIDAFLAQGWKPLHIEREALMLAFAEREVRTVDKGTINFKGRTWFGDFLMGVQGRVTVCYPRIAAPEFELLLVLSQRGEVLGAAAPQHSYGLGERAGAEEATRRRKAFRLLVSDRIEQAGGPLDEAALAGFRGQMLGLDATLARAEAAAEQVQPEGELAELAQAYAAKRAQLSENTRRLMARAQAAREAESLTRLAFDDEETRLARAQGF